MASGDPANDKEQEDRRKYKIMTGKQGGLNRLSVELKEYYRKMPKHLEQIVSSTMRNNQRRYIILQCRYLLGACLADCCMSILTDFLAVSGKR